MIIISKSMIALSALMSAGLVAAVDMGAPTAVQHTAVSQVAQRFPLPSEMFSPVPLTQFAAMKFAAQQRADGSKGDKLATSDACERQGWPYFAQQCLVSPDGGPVRKVSRVITLERRIGDNTSELVRMPVTDLAQR
jgi:hypothetical protein